MMLFRELSKHSRYFAAFLAAIVIIFARVEVNAGYLYVLNDSDLGSQIYGFSVDESTGALSLLPGFPVSPGLGGINSIVSERMFADPANNRLYAVNDVSDTVAAYSVDPATGAITALPFSPITLGTGGWNSIAVHPSGSPVVVANNTSTTPLVHSFVITASTATPAAGSPFAFTGTSGFSSEFSTDGNYYYVGGNTNSNIAGFSVDSSTGVLTLLPGSPFAAGASNVLAYAADTSGRLFSVDTADAIRIFTSSAGALTPVTGNPFISGLTQRRFGIMHPNQNFYIVAGNTGNNVGVYQISGTGSDTIVTPVAGSPFPTGATTANTLVTNLAGTFLYVGNRISRSVTTFSVNTTTGVLTNLGSQPSNTLGTTGAINGMAYLPAVTLENASISGRVSSDLGGLDGVTYVTLVSGGGTINMSARVNSFGYFSFSGLPTNTTYTLTPVRKGTTFSPSERTIMLTGNVADANFSVTAK